MPIYAIFSFAHQRYFIEIGAIIWSLNHPWRALNKSRFFSLGTDITSTIQSTKYFFCIFSGIYCITIQWRHNERDGDSNHRPHDCLLNRLFKTQIKENIKAPSHWPLWGEFTGWSVNSPHKGPVTRKMFPFDDVIILKSDHFSNHSVSVSSIAWPGQTTVKCPAPLKPCKISS